MAGLQSHWVPEAFAKIEMPAYADSMIALGLRVITVAAISVAANYVSIEWRSRCRVLARLRTVSQAVLSTSRG